LLKSSRAEFNQTKTIRAQYRFVDAGHLNFKLPDYKTVAQSSKLGLIGALALQS